MLAEVVLGVVVLAEVVLSVVVLAKVGGRSNRCSCSSGSRCKSL